MLGRKSRTTSAAIEDIRPAISDNPFARSVQDGIDVLQEEISSLLPFSEDMGTDDDAADDDVRVVRFADEPEFITDEPPVLLLVGEKIKVFWPDDNKYYTGVVERIYEESGKHVVHYFGNDKELLDMVHN